MRVKLTYFKPDTGRYYAGAEYDSECDPWDIPGEVRMLRDRGSLPGLKEGSNNWHILIETGIPHLIPARTEVSGCMACNMENDHALYG